MKKPRVLLLAAGHGRRAGGPKAWLDCGGRPMLQAQLQFLKKVVSDPSKIAVSVQGEWLDRCRALSDKVTWVPVDPDLPPMASLQALIKAGRVEPSWMYHVDMPVFDAKVFEKLAEQTRDAQPAHNGKKGHPVFLTTLTLLDVLRLNPAKDRLDEFLDARGTVTVEVDTDLILRNQNEAAT